MGSVNTVILVGNLGADPELRYTKSEPPRPVCNLRLATSFKGRGGGPAKTEWHRVVAWNADAENCAKFLRKGSNVYVMGRLETRAFEDRDHQKRYMTEIMAERIVFMPRGEQETPPASAAAPPRREPAAPEPMDGQGEGAPEDDIPW